MTEEWEIEVSKKPKLRTFKTFKKELHVEPYVKYVTDRQGRSLFAQLRCGILPLRIETGRFARIPVEERLCELCGESTVEDEFHFVSVGGMSVRGRASLLVSCGLILAFRALICGVNLNVS